MSVLSANGETIPQTISSNTTPRPPIDMKDEYGEMDCSGETYIAKNFVLESGYVLPEAHVRTLSLDIICIPAEESLITS